VGLDRSHGGVGCCTEVCCLGQRHERREAGLVRDVEHRAGLVVVGGDRAASGGLGFEFGSDLLEPVLGVGEEDQSEDRASVLGRAEGRVRPHLIGCPPQRPPHLCQISRVHVAISSVRRCSSRRTVCAGDPPGWETCPGVGKVLTCRDPTAGLGLICHPAFIPVGRTWVVRSCHWHGVARLKSELLIWSHAKLHGGEHAPQVLVGRNSGDRYRHLDHNWVAPGRESLQDACAPSTVRVALVPGP
jgi:hypothetical protein